MTKTYPRDGDKQTIYLNAVVKNPQIEIGDYTIYNDFVNDPVHFEKNNVLYHYPINKDRLVIGKFYSIACGAKFLFNSANHTQKFLSTYTFPLFFEEKESIDFLLNLKWRNWNFETIRQNINAISNADIVVLKTQRESRKQ